MRAAVFALLIALASPAPAPQFPDPSRQPPKQSHDFLTPHYLLKPAQVLVTLGQYHDAVRLYRRGETAQAITALSELPRPHIEVIMQTIRTQRGSLHADDIARFDWSRDDLAAAGMLHGDVRQDAVETLMRAVRALPASDEAAVRLAHVRMDLKQDARAAALLDRVVASEASEWWCLAALMRGEVYERAGDVTAAEDLYRRLIDRFPGCNLRDVIVAPTPNPRDTFVRIVSLFKSRYVLSYVPRGVPEAGWHPVDVRLKSGRADIRARLGYQR